jgi:hypothetical protein
MQFSRGQLLSGARQIGVDENRSMPFHQNWIDPPKEGSLKNTCSLLWCQSLVVGQQDRGFVLALNNEYSEVQKNMSNQQIQYFSASHGR